MIIIFLKEYYGGDECVWRVQVDQQAMCEFVQPKQITLTKCLRRAAYALEMNEWIDEVIVNDAKGG